MKKILSIIFIAGLLFSACNPMNDIYDEIDAKAISFIQKIEYTLTTDDYNAIGGDVKKYQNFSQFGEAKDYLPIFLAKKYPGLTQGSSALVTYNYFIGDLSYLSDLTSAVSYELTTADYDSMGENSGQPGKYNNFDSNTPPENYLPAFLASKYPSSKSGDLVLVTYKYYSSGSTSIKSDFYKFSGTAWAKYQITLPAGVTSYELATADYDSMGEASGQPGKYNNFSSSIDPADYLPKFLTLKFPYASEGTKMAVVYVFYKGGTPSTEKRAIEYTLTDGVWKAYESVIAKTDQYVYGTAGWSPDPTIYYTMVKDDYQIIVDKVKTTHSSNVDSYGTAEDYYGTSAYYSEFRIASTYFDSKFTTWEDAVKEAIGEIFLPAKYPSAAAQVDGIDINYAITFLTYNSGTMINYSITFQCTKSGPNPEFTYVSGPTKQ